MRLLKLQCENCGGPLSLSVDSQTQHTLAQCSSCAVDYIVPSAPKPEQPQPTHYPPRYPSSILYGSSATYGGHYPAGEFYGRY